MKIYIFYVRFSLTEPDWVSVILGVFVCQGCSLIHRSIPSLNQVKSVLQDTFDDKETEVSHNDHRKAPGLYFDTELFTQICLGSRADLPQKSSSP